jgi:hypothetical protein
MIKYLNLKRNKSIVFFYPFLFLAFVLSFSNIKFFTLIGASIQPVHFIYIFLILLTIKNVGLISNLGHLSFYIIFPFFSFFNVTSTIEFLKTYVIYLLILISFLYILPFVLTFPKRILENIISIFIFVSFILGFFGIIQFIFINFYNNFYFYNFFGPLQFHPHYIDILFGFYRSTSVYLEPSFFGWVTLTNFTFILYLTKKKIIQLQLFLIIGLFQILFVLVTLSASTIISFGFIIISFFLFNIKRPLIFSILFSLIIFISIYTILIYSNYFDVLRLDTIFIPGSSGFRRIILPLINTIEVLSIYPIIGRGLGQIGIPSDILINSEYIYNGILSLIYTFGLSTLIFLFPIFKSIKKTLKEDKDSGLLLLNLILIYFSTGELFGFNTVTIIILSYILISVGKKWKIQN